ncbi:unnamed protein product [Blepharisma stoltei]|uniref:FCP1 homology domain-containing protein n=1 Tax=Blepharisma stoltei TaxID=1481888 RepID=A0AAU9KLZ5_9CILI|nr:unnamed protein product [Blepharisma stoltei]
MAVRLAFRQTNNIFSSSTQDKVGNLKKLKKFEILLPENESLSSRSNRATPISKTPDLRSSSKLKQRAAILFKPMKTEVTEKKSITTPNTPRSLFLNTLTPIQRPIHISFDLVKNAMENKTSEDCQTYFPRPSSSAKILKPINHKSQIIRAVTPTIKSVKTDEELFKSLSAEMVTLEKSKKFFRKRVIKSKTSATCSLEDEKSEEKVTELIIKDHLYQTYLALKTTRELSAPDIQLVRIRQVNFPKRSGYENKKTIVFDLDETLVHCCEEINGDSDVQINVTLPSGVIAKTGINIRPYAIECLKEASKLFEVIVFTASHKAYADAVLDYLDPNNLYIHHRLYRESCIYLRGIMVKDLRILLNRKLQDIAIVDNSVYSFGFQADNGIPIISWTNRKEDKELLSLINYMKLLAKAHDVRILNRQTFQLHTFYQDYIDEFINSS